MGQEKKFYFETKEICTNFGFKINSRELFLYQIMIILEKMLQDKFLNFIDNFSTFLEIEIKTKNFWQHYNN